MTDSSTPPSGVHAMSAPLRPPRHVCPPWCHRCPDLEAIAVGRGADPNDPEETTMPFCMGGAVYGPDGCHCDENLPVKDVRMALAKAKARCIELERTLALVSYEERMRAMEAQRSERTREVLRNYNQRRQAEGKPPLPLAPLAVYNAAKGE